MTQAKSVEFKPLHVTKLPLYGTHLIEASAGTGKTYNITRIYLRMLIEKKLTVQQILVMTFTKDATEELRGRVRKDIQFALKNWGSFDNSDPFFTEMQANHPASEAMPILHNALLHMDESSIFTIHGFCNRVLQEQAFASSLEFSMNMEADTQELELDCIRDYYRLLAKTDEAAYSLITSKWITPESFYQAFSNTLSNCDLLTSPNIDGLKEDFKARCAESLNELESNKDRIIDAVIAPHKEAVKRTGEFEILIDWLTKAEGNIPKAAKDFLNGGRYRKAENKALVEYSLVFKAEADDLLKNIESSRVYSLAANSISTIRKSITKAKERQQVMNFDDLIQRLDVVLQDDSEKTISDSIRSKFPVALIDEFQDTDPKQYRILTSIYEGYCDASHGNAIYMIGDPKQAIYGFRGGDIFAYLNARKNSDHNWLMDTNWRSSSQMITAYNRLFYGESLPATLDDQIGNDNVFNYGIDYIPVKSGGKSDKSPLVDPSGKSAMELTFFPAHEDYQPVRGNKDSNRADFCTVISSWCASEVSRLLCEEVSIDSKRVQESDIAILVRSGSEAALIGEALSELGLSSVYLSNKENLFKSVQAHDLYTALDGILNLEDGSKMMAGLSTRFLGGSSQLLEQIQNDEVEWENSQAYLKELRQSWEEKGFMQMALTFVHQTYVPESNDHERALTNTIHLLELLQQASVRFKQPRQLVRYLRDQIVIDTKRSESELRLESDDNLIKIVTQHGCKGLEYPIVFLPFVSKYSDPTKFGTSFHDIQIFHNDEDQLVKQLGHDKGGIEKALEEGSAESVRLLYVAVTRAIHRCYICATPFDKAELSPLSKTLGIDEADQLENKLNELSVELPNDIGFTRIEDISFDAYNVTKASIKMDDYQASVFSGDIDKSWHLSSFSSLTRNVHAKSGISKPERLDDEIIVNNNVSANNIRFSLYKGARSGNLLHDIYERLDFSQPNYLRASRAPLFSYGKLPDGFEAQDVHDWIEDTLHCEFSLLNQDENICLAQIPKKHTLKEVEFYFPVANVNTYKLSKMLSRHRELPKTDHVRLPSTETLQGMMHGFIDLIFEKDGRYFVADYKSTFLGDQLADYSVDAMSYDMQSHYYDLQYLIYSVALHRYLSSRIEDYDPEIHFGGVYYFYLRGMSKDANTGVYGKTISSDSLIELDSIFQGQ